MALTLSLLISQLATCLSTASQLWHHKEQDMTRVSINTVDKRWQVSDSDLRVVDVVLRRAYV